MARKPKPDPRAQLVARRGEFVRVAGKPVSIGCERGFGPRHNDHVWININAGGYGRLRIAINTFSLRNYEAGFDSSVRVGIARGTYEILPKAGVFKSKGLDYAKIEKSLEVNYEDCAQSTAESIITVRANSAFFVEAWGDLYARDHFGIHQVHSRRASCAVPHDIVGRDGALKFYFGQDSICEMLLFKFCGQP
jgi:hypothetical protein